jgi:hypothetical protein
MELKILKKWGSKKKRCKRDNENSKSKEVKDYVFEQGSQCVNSMSAASVSLGLARNENYAHLRIRNTGDWRP